MAAYGHQLDPLLISAAVDSIDQPECTQSRTPDPPEPIHGVPTGALGAQLLAQFRLVLFEMHAEAGSVESAWVDGRGVDDQFDRRHPVKAESVVPIAHAHQGVAVPFHRLGGSGLAGSELLHDPGRLHEFVLHLDGPMCALPPVQPTRRRKGRGSERWRRIDLGAATCVAAILSEYCTYVQY
jgi:hypothetical protein